MLGLGNTVSNKSRKPIFHLTRINDLVGWWDFGDRTTMYTDNGTSIVTTHGDLIYRVDNKAYTLQRNNVNAMGSYLLQDTETNRPIYSTGGGTLSCYFDGTDNFLFANKHSGSTATASMSASTINGADLTIFFINKAFSASVAADNFLIGWNGADPTDFQKFYVDNDTNDRWQWHDGNATARTNTLLNCGENLTTNKELWTLHLDHTSQSSFYRNGVQADGINNSGSADNHNIDLSPNDNDCSIRLGGSGSEYYRGYVMEVVIYNRALKEIELRNVNNYLLTKHGL